MYPVCTFILQLMLIHVSHISYGIWNKTKQNKHRMVESTTISSYNYMSMMYTTCTTHLIFIFFNHHNIIGWHDSFGEKLWNRLFKFHFLFGSWSFFPLSLVGTDTTTRVVVLDEDNSLFDFRRCILNLVFADNSLFDNFFKRSSVDSSCAF